MKLYERNIALEWYQYGLEKSDDFFMRFMMHWVAFNWLYNSEEGESTERGKIRQYYFHNKHIFAKYDAFSTPDIAVFLEGPVYGSVDPKKAKDDYEGVKNKDIRCLLMTLYRVRCNLFHGSKSLMVERDQALVRASANVLEGYLRVLMDNR